MKPTTLIFFFAFNKLATRSGSGNNLWETCQAYAKRENLQAINERFFVPMGEISSACCSIWRWVLCARKNENENCNDLTVNSRLITLSCCANCIRERLEERDEATWRPRECLCVYSHITRGFHKHRDRGEKIRINSTVEPLGRGLSI